MADGADDGISRRTMLALAGSAAGAGLIGGYLFRDEIASEAFNAVENTYRRIKRRNDTDLDGLPDDREASDDFHTYLAETFDTPVGELDPAKKDLIIDARYVAGEEFPDEHKQYLAELFEDRIGVDLHWLDYPETYPRDTFIDEYGYRPADILWGDDSFYAQEVEDELQTAALQIVFTPGKPDGEHDGSLYCAPGEEYAGGFSALNRVAMADLPADDELITVLHEIMHLGNWEHNYDDPDDPGVMGQQEVADATPDQWENLAKRLHLVNLSAPSFVYDQAVEMTECRDLHVPE